MLSYDKIIYRTCMVQRPPCDRLLYKLGIKKRITLPVPVIVVGNITVGGNGKTPVVVWLAKLLTEQGFNVGVISRGYGGQSREPLIVRVNTSAEVCGD